MWAIKITANEFTLAYRYSMITSIYNSIYWMVCSFKILSHWNHYFHCPHDSVNDQSFSLLAKAAQLLNGNNNKKKNG